MIICAAQELEKRNLNHGRISGTERQQSQATIFFGVPILFHYLYDLEKPWVALSDATWISYPCSPRSTRIVILFEIGINCLALVTIKLQCCRYCFLLQYSCIRVQDVCLKSRV